MIEIRKTSGEDFADVLLLLEQLWPNQALNAAALRRVFSAALASDHQVYLSACDDSRVVGFAALTVKNNLWQAGNLGHLDELVVDAARRGQGIGSRLLESIAEEAQRRGCTRLELDTAFHREAAHAFYERLGFERRAFLFSRRLVAE